MAAAPEATRLVLRRADPTDAPAMAALHVTCWRKAYAKLLPARTLDALCVGERAFMWARMLTDRGHGALRGAHMALRDAARSASAPAAGSGHAHSRSPASTARSRLSTLATAGSAGMALWVLRENDPARRFYERLGGAPVAERAEPARDGTSAEIAYGWRDVGMLASERRGRLRPPTLRRGWKAP